MNGGSDGGSAISNANDVFKALPGSALAKQRPIRLNALLAL